MIRTEKRMRICTTMLILLLCFIWGNSLLPGSVSGAFSDWVKSILEAILPGSDSSPSGGGRLRKIAHFTEFAALGACLLWRMSMLKKKPVFALLWGAAAACTDETIQIFVPDRGPSLRDVGIDTCGVLTGMLLLQTGYFLWRKHKPLTFGGNNK